MTHYNLLKLKPGADADAIFAQCEAVYAALEAELPGITAVQCDVASRASCELAFRAAEQALGRVDVLHHA